MDYNKVEFAETAKKFFTWFAVMAGVVILQALARFASISDLSMVFGLVTIVASISIMVQYRSFYRITREKKINWVFWMYIGTIVLGIVIVSVLFGMIFPIISQLSYYSSTPSIGEIQHLVIKSLGAMSGQLIMLLILIIGAVALIIATRIQTILFFKKVLKNDMIAKWSTWAIIVFVGEMGIQVIFGSALFSPNFISALGSFDIIRQAATWASIAFFVYYLWLVYQEAENQIHRVEEVVIIEEDEDQE